MAMVNVPLGFRFYPKDSDLINYFLATEISGEPRVGPRMPRCEIYESHPSAVFDSFGTSDREEENTVRYFFTTLKNKSTKSCDKKDRMNKVRRVRDIGTWRHSRSDEVVVTNSHGEDVVIGYRKLFNFRESSSNEKCTVNQEEWLMHEFSTVNHPHNVDDLVLCRITKKLPKLDRDISKKRPLSVIVVSVCTDHQQPTKRLCIANEKEGGSYLQPSKEFVMADQNIDNNNDTFYELVGQGVPDVDELFNTTDDKKMVGQGDPDIDDLLSATDDKKDTFDWEEMAGQGDPDIDDLLSATDDKKDTFDWEEMAGQGDPDIDDLFKDMAEKKVDQTINNYGLSTMEAQIL